jgi:DNA-binding PadR family transcriptional regulator
MARLRMGRFGGTAIWILVALRHGPRSVAQLLDAVRGQGDRVGPGTLYGAIVRLEWLDLIATPGGGGARGVYRLVQPTRPAATEVATS